MKNFWISKTFFLIILCLLFLLNLHNTLTFPSTRGLDATAHIEYIQFLQTENRIPLPSEGWELYQPPAYYLLTSFLPSLRLAQIFGIVIWLSLVVGSYYFFKNKNLLLRLIATLLVASLPVIIYQVPALSNELFSAVLITLTMIYYLKVFLKKINHQTLTIKHHLILGLLLSLSLLSKATAVLLIPTILLERLVLSHVEGLYPTKVNLRLVFKNFYPSILVTSILSAWFYLRNLWLYGNPLISSADFPSWSSFGQAIVPRNFYFFTNLKGFLNLDFFHSQNYSLLSGTYFSFFYDAHNVIIPPQSLPTLGIIIFFLSIPIFLLMLKGIYVSLKTKLNSSSLFFMLYSAFLTFGYVLYNFKLPYYSTVKGSFLTSLSLPFTYFFIRGIENWSKNKKLVVLIYLSIYALIICKHFWVEGWWY